MWFCKHFIVLTLIFRSLIHLNKLIIMDREIGVWDGQAWKHTGSSALIWAPIKHSFHLSLAVVFDFYIFPLAKTVNSSILQYDLESLTRKTSYTVWVKASTSAGGVDGPRINFKTLSISEYSFIPWECLLGISPRPVTGSVCQGQGEAK